MGLETNSSTVGSLSYSLSLLQTHFLTTTNILYLLIRRSMERLSSKSLPPERESMVFYMSSDSQFYANLLWIAGPLLLITSYYRWLALVPTTFLWTNGYSFSRQTSYTFLSETGTTHVWLTLFLIRFHFSGRLFLLM